MAGRFGGARMISMAQKKEAEKNALKKKTSRKGSRSASSESFVSFAKAYPIDISYDGTRRRRRHRPHDKKKHISSSQSVGKRHQQYEPVVDIDLVEYGLTEDLVDEFKEAFMLIDKDEDGLINKKELKTIMKSLGQRPSDRELQKLVDDIETCCDGTIEFNEFLQMMSKKLKSTGDRAELKEAFKVFDKKNAGYLTSDELRHVMTSMGEKMTLSEVEDMIKEASPRGSGMVHYDEFIGLLAKKD